MTVKGCNTERAFDFVTSAYADPGRYFSEVAHDIHAQLLGEGAVVIRGANPCRDPAVFEKAVGALDFQPRDYVGGSSPRSTIQGKVMEATRTPPDWSIILHQEMAYVQNPPEIIAFVCVEPAGKGGESVVGDMRKMEQLVDRSILNQLTERGLKLRRTLPDNTRVTLKPGVKKSWQETFSTSSTTKAETLCRARGWDFEWSTGDLVLWQDCISPMLRHPRKAADIWCNQAHFWGAAAMIEWARIDGREQDASELAKVHCNNPELLEAMCFSDGEPLPETLTLELFHTVRSLERDVDLGVGDILLLDNFQYAHGRRAFSGNRTINVIIADWADDQSRVAQG